MTLRPLRVLLVEDSEDDARMLVRELRRGGYEASWRRVDTAVDLDAALEESWDVILSDYSIPGFGATQAFAAVRSRGLDVPFILVSGTIGEEAAVEAMRSGVHDFVLKDRLARLAPAIGRELTEAAHRADLRRAQSALLRAEKLRALGQMAAGIAHDFKNLLNPLGLHVEVLERALRRAGVERPDVIGTMRDIIRHGVETIDRLRTFSRLEPELIAAYIDVAALAREAIELVRPRLAERDGLALADTIGSTELVRGHASDVVAAIVNLLVNAIEACGPHGRISVRAGSDEGAVWVEVGDNGSGMTADVQARVFEPFFSTKGPQGTGLGLANVFATMQRHGGDIVVDSAPGRGARFTLRFPTK
jgi:signal transduction histidine kinase